MKLSNGMKGLGLSAIAAILTYVGSIFSKRNAEELMKAEVEKQVTEKLAELTENNGGE